MFNHIKKELTKTDLCAGIGGPCLPGVTNISVWICSLKAATKPLRKTKSCFCWLNCSICSEHHLIQSSSVCREKNNQIETCAMFSNQTVKEQTNQSLPYSNFFAKVEKCLDLDWPQLLLPSHFQHCPSCWLCSSLLRNMPHILYSSEALGSVA